MLSYEYIRVKKLVVHLLFVCISIFFLVGSASAFVLGPTHLPEHGSSGKWGEFGDGTPGGVVTWSLMPTGITKNGVPAFTSLADFMPYGYKRVIKTAFYVWSQVANIQFLEVPDAGEAFGATVTDSADIRIGGHFFESNATLAHAFYPAGWQGGEAGDIHFNSSTSWTHTDSGPGFNIYRVATHEIGHAIGLGHENSVTALMNTYYTESTPLGLLADDIEGAQYLYGVAGVPTVSNPISRESNPVPEPGTIVLVGIGALGLFGYGWRQRRKLLAVK